MIFTPEHPYKYSINILCVLGPVRLHSMDGILCMPRINVPYDYAGNVSESWGITGISSSVHCA